MKLKNLFLASSVLFAGNSLASTMPISGGSATGIALCKEGYVYAWGENTNSIVSNILCLDSTIARYESKEFYAEPQRVNTNGIIFEQVTAGSGSTFFGISDKGILYYWGYTSANKKISIIEPTPIKCGDAAGYNEDGTPGGEYLGNVAKVDGSTEGFIALLKNGTVVVSENCTSLQFAQDENGNTLKDIKDICAGDDLFYVLDSSKKILKTGIIGESTKFTNVFTPVLSEKTGTPLSNVKTIASGDCCSFAVTIDGKAYGWGNGGWGYCTGTGEAKNTVNANPIVAGDYKTISGQAYLTNVKEIGGGRGYGAAVTFDGYLLYWGNNDNNGGTAGIDTTAESLREPVFLKYKDGSIVNDAVSISCGDNFAFVVNKKNQYFAFGLNKLGQCGVGSDSETINYLHPMDMPCELPTLCPSVYSKMDTITTCGDGSTAIEAITSSVFDDSDYTLSWYLNGQELAETSAICTADADGEYKVVMTPNDSQCEATSVSIIVKPNDIKIESVDTIVVEKVKDIEKHYAHFVVTSAEKKTLIFYSDINCDDAIDTFAIKAGKNNIEIDGSKLSSIEDSTINVWAKENKQSTLHPQEEISETVSGIFIKNGMLFQSANKAVLHSFKIKGKSFINSAVLTVTPSIYRVAPDVTGDFAEMELFWTGTEQKFEVGDTGTECTVICDVALPNDGVYALGMDADISGEIISHSTPELDQNATFFEEPVDDVNRHGIQWVGSTAHSYTSAVGYSKTCYYDLVFTDIESEGCGVIKASTVFKVSEGTDSKVITNENNLNGDKFDILGRKVTDVEHNKIFIQNGKKFIIKK